MKIIDCRTFPQPHKGFRVEFYAKPEADVVIYASNDRQSKIAILQAGYDSDSLEWTEAHFSK